MDSIKWKSSSFQPIINDPKKFIHVRDLLRSQKIMMIMLQPNKRSFSNPEFHDNDVNQADFQSFRQLLISQNFQKITNGQSISSNDCHQLNRDTQNIGCDNDSSKKPTPIPRKNRNKKQNEICKDSNITITSTNVDSYKDENYKGFSNTLDNSPTITTIDVVNNNDYHTSLKTLENLSLDVVDVKNQNSFLRKPIERLVKSPKLEIPTINTQIKIKTNKNSFRSFLKINKIRSNKFLSLRTKNIANNRKSLMDFNTVETNSTYKRPTRTPPPPPVLVFRPAAPLPEESEDRISIKSNPTTMTTEIQNSSKSSTISELYHDSANLYDVEDIYCSVEDENIKTSTDISDNGECSTLNILKVHKTNQHLNSLNENEGYYDDGLCIYEELSSNEGTIYEDYGEKDNGEDIIYDNSEFMEINNSFTQKNDDKKCLKRFKKMEKMMKRFNLSGEEIPINAGVVKQDSKGRSKNDLMVHKGETILILRMENNPRGKWLAKNERSKIGYIDLNNVFLETDSIKAAFQSFNSI